MFSIIIPYHNREQSLHRLFNSLEKCTVLPSQIILVNNASTDNSVKVCRDFVAKHPQWPVELIDEPCLGACCARNTGLRAVHTEWVYFFDSDDELSSDYFEQVLNEIQQNPNVDLLACATRMVFPNGEERIRRVFCTDSVADQILVSHLATQGMFLRTSFVREIGGWDETLPVWNDWEFGLRLLLKGARIRWISSVAFHRINQHDDSLTGRGLSSNISGRYLTMQTVYKQLQPHHLYVFAWACRAMWLAGILYKENHRQQSHEIYQDFMKEIVPHCSLLQRVYLRLLYVYVRNGGRASWLISRKVLVLLKIMPFKHCR